MSEGQVCYALVYAPHHHADAYQAERKLGLLPITDTDRLKRQG